jgi:hypothetical protein
MHTPVVGLIIEELWNFSLSVEKGILLRCTRKRLQLGRVGLQSAGRYDS